MTNSDERENTIASNFLSLASSPRIVAAVHFIAVITKKWLNPHTCIGTSTLIQLLDSLDISFYINCSDITYKSSTLRICAMIGRRRKHSKVSGTFLHPSLKRLGL
jgi:hypothetical protein